MKRILLLLLWTIILGGANTQSSATEKIQIAGIKEDIEIEIPKSDSSKLTIMYGSPFTSAKHKFCNEKDNLYVYLLGGSVQAIKGCITETISKSDFKDKIVIKKLQDDTTPIVVDEVSAGDIIWIFNKDKKSYTIHLKKDTDAQTLIQDFANQNKELFTPKTKSTTSHK